MKQMLLIGLLAASLGAGCASTGSVGSSEGYSSASCANLRQIAQNEKGNPDRQEKTRTEYRNNCQGK